MPLILEVREGESVSLSGEAIVTLAKSTRSSATMTFQAPPETKIGRPYKALKAPKNLGKKTNARNELLVPKRMRRETEKRS